MERILCRYHPELRHCGLRSVKQKDGLTFPDYAQMSLGNLKDLKIPKEEFSSKSLNQDLVDWKKVVIFYTLRLFLAPLIETIILYDRMLWIMENNPAIDCVLKVTFDPRISPRNHVMIARKNGPTNLIDKSTINN